MCVSVCKHEKIVIFSIFKYILPFCIIFANPLKLDMGISVVDSFFMLFFSFFNDVKRIEWRCLNISRKEMKREKRKWN